MRRSALLCCALATSGLLAGCTGTGVFLDHTFNSFGNNPNSPAGSSEMFMRLRGEPVAITPLVPEAGNVWPGPQKPDPTLQELEQQQNAAGAPSVVGGGTDHQQPRPAEPPQQPGSAPSAVRPNPPPPNLVTPPLPPTPNDGSSVSGTGSQNVPGYRQPLPQPQPGRGILVPNGNGTSTLIGPDGSVSTVPTKP